jgi:D-alanyl-D-alanine carboxypeptidase (penicillin-binding protein 5/6)
MTIHLAMTEIKAGRAALDEIIPIGLESWAQSQPPRSSLMFLAPGQIVTLREIMLGLSVSSGNDAATALALRFAPSVDAFAGLMTREARRMGLRITRFVEASGISEYNMTTAEEFAYFCRQYINLYPQNLKDFHSVPVLSYPLAHNVAAPYRNDPRTITQDNRNSLLWTFPGVDGLKTGYIDEAGYNIALTAQRADTRFLLVLLGAESARSRSADGEKLLSWAFANFKTIRPVITSLETPRLWKGKKANTVELQLAHSANFTSPTNRAGECYYRYYYPQHLIAPLPAGAIAGYLIIYDDHGDLNHIPLVTTRAYEKGNIFKRLWHSIRLLFL